jgi:RHS repeat-associated protein
VGDDERAGTGGLSVGGEVVDEGDVAVRYPCMAVVAVAAMALTAVVAPDGPMTTRSAVVPEAAASAPFAGGDLIATDVVAGRAVGSAEGEGGVTADGTSSYSIPLDVPPGRAGVQPALSLEYRSQAGDGPLGVGWILAGLTQIRRCARTFAQDGGARAVTWTDGPDGDRYCLEGQRLVVTGGPDGPDSVYGGDGTEYRTERDTHIKVVSHGADGLGPAYFEVYLANGTIQTYGGTDTPNARLEGARAHVGYSNVGPTPDSHQWPADYTQKVRHSWALTRIADRAGNYLSVHYLLLESAAHGYEQLPSAISYTRSLANPSTPFSRVINFQYAVRPDPSADFVAGLRVEQNQRLTGVEMRWRPPGASDQVMHRYRLGYKLGGTSGRSLLSQVEECDGAGVCFPPMTFEWSAGSGDSFSDVDTGIPVLMDGSIDVPVLRIGDLDGDGRDDIDYRDNSPGGGALTNCKMPAPAGSVGCRHLPRNCVVPNEDFVAQPDGRIIDLDGDSRDDLVFLERERCGDDPRVPPRFINRIYVDLATSPRAVHDNVEQFSAYTKPAYQLDMNGDSLPESVFADYSAYRPNIGGGLGPYRATGVRPLFDDNAQGLAADLDGSGRASLIVPGTCSFVCGTAAALTLDGDKPVVSPLNALSARPGFAQPVYADVTGDGLPDWLSQPLKAGALNVAVNTGNGFLTPAPWTIPAPYDRSPAVNPLYTSANPFTANPLTDIGVRVLDYNRDGRQDLMLMSGAPHPSMPLSTLAVLLSTGSGFRPVSLSPAIPVGANANAPAQSQPNDFHGWRLSGVLDANGDGLTDFVQVTGGTLHLYLRTSCTSGANPQCVPGDLLTQVVNGTGVTETFGYAPMGDVSVHQRGDDCRYPQTCAVRGRWPVVRHQVTAPGTATRQEIRFRYADGRADLTGRGWLGFGSRHTTDIVHEHDRSTVYDNRTRVGDLYPCAGMARSQTATVALPEGRSRRTTVVAECTVVPTADGRAMFAYAGTTETRQSEGTKIDAKSLQRLARTHTVKDAYGATTLADSETYRVRDGVPSGRPERHTTRSEVDNFAGSWLIAQVARTEETSTTAAGEATTRTTAYGYDPDSGMLASVAVEPQSRGAPEAGSDLYLQITVRRDGFGLPNVISSGDGTGLNRIDRIDYDPGEHLFPIAVTNAAGHLTRFRFANGLGLPVAVTDPNGITTSYQYDRFARPRTADVADDADTVLHYGATSEGRPTVSSTVGGGKAVTVERDAYGRESSRIWPGFDGAAVTAVAEYDEAGDLVTAAWPRTAAEPERAERYRYDRLGRMLSATHPDGTSDTAEYRGLQTTYRNEQGIATVVTVDEQERVETSAQPLGARQLVSRYTYGPFDQTATFVAPDGAITSLSYDRRGRVVSVTNPDEGTTTSSYNAFGEVVRDNDGRNTLRVYERDAIGRASRITAGPAVETFSWDTSAHGIGLPTSGRSADNVATTYRYDELSRLVEQTDTVDGQAMTMTAGYDAFSRLATLTYPAVPGRAALQATYGYTAQGELAKLSDAGSGVTYWTARSRNALGQPVEDVLGNGLITKRGYDQRNRLKTVTSAGAGNGPVPVQSLTYGYHPDGSVADRTDLLHDISDVYEYDTAQRMTTWHRRVAQQTSTTRYEYSDGGNITAATTDSAQTRSYAYGEAGAGPHAVTAVSGAGGGTYRYDSAGNQVGGPGRNIDYTRFNLPSRVRSGAHDVRYRYDISDSRATATDGSNSTRYLGKWYERRNWPGRTEDVFTLIAGPEAIAQITWTRGAGGQQVAYRHPDALGSIDVMSVADGSSAGRFEYQAFGSRRLIPTAGAPNAGSVMLAGFGGHEHDSTGLINMQGRMYDPALGRFLSPDPVEDLAGQAANPYSYVANHPATSVDPTGWQEDGDSNGGGTWKHGDSSGNCGSSCSFEGDTYTSARKPAGGTTDPPAAADAPVTCLGTCGGGPVPPVADDAPTRERQIPRQHAEDDITGSPVSMSGLRFPNALNRPRRNYINPVAESYVFRGIVNGRGYLEFADLIEAGHVCAACHLTHNIGHEPTDDEFDYSRYFSSVYATAFAAALINVGLSVGNHFAVNSSPQPRRRYGPGAQNVDEPEWPTMRLGVRDCTDCARIIQKQVGGDIITISRRTPNVPLGKSGPNPAGNWFTHDVVVTENGRVYDSWTRQQGMLAAEYKATFTQAYDINFGF